jgi:general secretion pathway protein L
MKISEEYKLFGIDLSIVLRRIQLGLRQVVWGQEVGLYDWIQKLSLPASGSNSKSSGFADPAEGSQYKSAVVPLDQTLVLKMEMPQRAEVYLDEVVAAQVHTSSPFPAEDTRWGYAITSRTADVLQLIICVTHRESAEEARLIAATDQQCEVGDVEVLARSDTTDVALRDYMTSHHRELYFSKLISVGARLGSVLLGLLILISTPVLVVTQTASQYETLLAQTREETRTAVNIRGHLSDRVALLNEAEAFFERDVDYLPWLHKLAELTPDSAYLSRIGLDGSRLTIAGQAANAAEYQAVLANAGLFAEISSPSAFVRDQRSGKERFTLTMKFVSVDP